MQISRLEDKGLFGVNNQYKEYLEQQNKRIKHIIHALDFEKLNDWEEEFVVKWETMSDEGRFVSDRVMEIMEKLYKEKSR